MLGLLIANYRLYSILAISAMICALSSNILDLLAVITRKTTRGYLACLFSYKIYYIVVSDIYVLGYIRSHTQDTGKQLLDKLLHLFYSSRQVLQLVS